MSSDYDYVGALKRIGKIEEGFPIDSLRYNGYAIWPLIRYDLFNQFHSIWKLSGSPEYNLRDFDSVKGIKKLISSSYWNWTAQQAEFKQLKKRKSYNKLNTKSNAKKADFVYFSIAVHRSVQRDGKYYNRCTDSVSEFLADYGTGLKIECDLADYDYKPTYDSVYDIDADLIKHHYSNTQSQYITQFFGGSRLEIENIDTFESWLNEQYPELVLNKYPLIQQLDRIMGYKKFFDQYFDIVQPKVLFLDIFFHIRAYAAILSAKERGIKTVDVQHGIQGKFHIHYGMYRNVPTKGYDIMPEYFWCWAKCDIDAINDWADKSNGAHKAILGGNPYLTLIKEGEISSKLDPLSHIEKPIITFALQTFSDLGKSIIEFVVEAIKNLESQYFFVFRTHPVFSKEKDLELLDQMTSELNPEDFIIQQSHEMNLYELLKKSEYIMSESSTVGIEGISFGAKLIALSEFGYSYFNDYLNEDEFLFATDSKTLEEHLRDNKELKSSDIIKASRETVQEAIQKLLA